MNKRFIIALSLLLLLSTYNIQNNFTINSKFSVEKIIIENNSIVKKKDVKEKLSFLLKTNLFFLRTNKIKSKLSEIDLIESFEINFLVNLTKEVVDIWVFFGYLKTNS